MNLLWQASKQIKRHKPKFHLARHVMSRHDSTFDASSESRRACWAVQFDKFDTAKMHGLNKSTCRVVRTQVEFGLYQRLCSIFLWLADKSSKYQGTGIQPKYWTCQQSSGPSMFFYTCLTPRQQCKKSKKLCSPQYAWWTCFDALVSGLNYTVQWFSTGILQNLRVP